MQLARFFAGVAQPVVQLIRNQQVEGSSPFTSSQTQSRKNAFPYADSSSGKAFSLFCAHDFEKWFECECASIHSEITESEETELKIWCT